MKNHRKIWITLGAIPSFVAILFVLLNAYVQSSSVKGKLTDALRTSLGVEVHIQHIRFTPWGGVQLSQISVAGEDEEQSLLSADRFKAKVQLLSLFTSHILIKQISIDSPKVTLTSGVSLKPEEAPASVVITGIPTQANTQQETSDTPNTEHSEVPAKKTTDSKPKKVKTQRMATIAKAVVNKGEFQYFNKDRLRIVFLEGIEIQSDLARSPNVEGEIQIEEGLLADMVPLTTIKSPFSFKDGVLNLPDLSGYLANGTMNGSFVWDTNAHESPAALTLTFNEAEVAELIRQMHWVPDRLSGKIAGTIQLKGEPDDADTFRGEGTLAITNGKFRQIDFLQSIGNILKIEELTEPTLKRAYADYTVDGKDIQIRTLSLESDNLKLEAEGKIIDGDTLNLKARLLFNQGLTKKLPKIARQNLVKTDTEYSALDFKITGTLSHPKTDLLDKLVGNKLERKVTDFLGKILGGSSKDK